MLYSWMLIASIRSFSISETGAAEARSIPEWSTQHFEATGRPLRIAIDQANWWYRNITADKEAEIKTSMQLTLVA